MGIPNERFTVGDVWIDYDHETVMFRFDFKSRRFFRKFYGESREDEVPHNNELLSSAIRFGDEIDANTYLTGKGPG